MCQTQTTRRHSLFIVRDQKNHRKGNTMDEYEKSQIDKEDLYDLKKRIKRDMPEWIATMERYDNPEITDMEEVWGI